MNINYFRLNCWDSSDYYSFALILIIPPNESDWFLIGVVFGAEPRNMLCHRWDIDSMRHDKSIEMVMTSELDAHQIQ